MIDIQCSEKVKKKKKNKMRKRKVKYKKKRIEQLYSFGILLFKILINYIVKL